MKVIMIDDELAMHLIVKRMVGKIDKVEMVGSFRETSGALSFMKENQVDLAFIDIHMPKENGLDFARKLREKDWKTKIVFLTSHKEFALPAFEVYAYDYIVKPLSQKRMVETLERALSEESKNEAGMSQETIPPLIEPLTKREIEVMRLMGNGQSNKEIAAAYKLSEGTVKNHVVNIFGKLQVKNRVQAILMAKSLKII